MSNSNSLDALLETFRQAIQKIPYTHRFRISYCEVDYSEVSPIFAEYHFERAADAFRGQVACAIGWARTQRRRPMILALPPVQQFLDTLAECEPTEWAYGFTQDRQNEFYRIEIELAVDEPLIIFTESQGNFREPWGIQYREIILRQRSSIPHQALGRLERLLDQPYWRGCAWEARQMLRERTRLQAKG